VTWPEKETQVAEPIVAWLVEMGWEVFQEVATRHGAGGRADIVARKKRLLWIVEVKRGLDLSLLAQGHEWKGRAHMVSLAYPKGKLSKTRRVAQHFAGLEGLGLIEVGKKRGWGDVEDQVRVEEVARPSITRRIWSPFKLNEGQKTYAKAGNADGRFRSPFKETCKRVREVVEQQPGLTIREVVELVDHHYASKQSAQNGLRTWAGEGAIEGVVLRGGTKAEGALRMYPAKWQGPLESRKLLAEAVKERRRPGHLSSVMGARR